MEPEMVEVLKTTVEKLNSLMLDAGTEHNLYVVLDQDTLHSVLCHFPIPTLSLAVYRSL